MAWPWPPHSRVPFYSRAGGDAKHFSGGEVARSGDRFVPVAGTADSSWLHFAALSVRHRNDKQRWALGRRDGKEFCTEWW